MVVDEQFVLCYVFFLFVPVQAVCYGGAGL